MTASVAWTTANAAIVTVDGGLVRGLGIGATRVTAAAGGKSASVDVIVSTSHTFRSMRGSSASDVWAVGDSGNVLRFNGSYWTRIESGTKQNLRGIWAFSPTDVWAVGAAGTLLHFNGTSWSSVGSGTTENLNDVWGFSPSQAWAVGGGGTVLRYNGLTWTSSTIPETYSLSRLWGFSNTDLWTVGVGAGSAAFVILHYDGLSWSRTGPTYCPRIAVGGTSSSDMWVLGGVGSDNLIGGNVSGDSCADHFDGVRWSSIKPQSFHFLYAIWPVSATDVWAAGTGIYRYNGTSWSSDLRSATSSAVVPRVLDLWGSSPSDIWAVGESGTILHYTGSTWQKISGS